MAGFYLPYVLPPRYLALRAISILQLLSSTALHLPTEVPLWRFARHRLFWLGRGGVINTSPAKCLCVTDFIMPDQR